MGRRRLTDEEREASIKRKRKMDVERRRLRRMDPEFREKERLRDTLARRVARSNPEYREAERVRNTLAHQIARMKCRGIDKEQLQANKKQKMKLDAECIQQGQTNPKFHEKEFLQDILAHQAATRDPKYQESEQLCNALVCHFSQMDHAQEKQCENYDSQASYPMDPKDYNIEQQEQ